MGGVCSTYGNMEMRCNQSVFVGKSETRIPLGRPGRRWGVILECTMFVQFCRRN